VKEPVRILSDLHLGHKASRIRDVSDLRPLIAGAGTVIFNGDTWEELAEPLRERSASMLDALRTLCAAEGAEAVFLTGNHDPGWPGCGWLELAGGVIIVTHGDAMLHSGSPWKREILTNPGKVEDIWRAHPAAEHDVMERLQVAREIAIALPSRTHSSGRHLIQRAWDAVVPPTRALRIIEAWRTQGSTAEAFRACYFPDATFLVTGHLHRPGCWENNNRFVINTGSFVSPGRAHWVEWNKGCLTRGFVNESRSIFRPGEILEAWKLDLNHK
jgi:predicted phosphodiesterase